MEAFTLDKLKAMQAQMRVVQEQTKGLPNGKIISNPNMVTGPFEDWSDVRSPGRAERRRRQGHKQRIRYFYKPDPKVLILPDGTMVCHPEIYERIKSEIGSEPRIFRVPFLS